MKWYHITKKWLLREILRGKVFLFWIFISEKKTSPRRRQRREKDFLHEESGGEVEIESLQKLKNAAMRKENLINFFLIKYKEKSQLI